MDQSSDLTPLILLVDDQEWTSRSIESILRPKGHVVLKAHTGQQALDLVAKVSPDAILVDVNLPDLDGIDLVRRLKESPTVHSTTPVLMITSSSIGRAQRLEALSVGAWDILTHPVDPNELILRMDTYVRAKQEADRVREEGLTDPSTGFYNVRGILRRAKEISADAVRSERPLTCVAFGPSSVANESDRDGSSRTVDDAISQPVAAAIRHVTRISDTVGSLGPGEFVVVAPGTDQDGAVRLADRVLDALKSQAERQGPGTGPVTETLARIRAGFCSVDAAASTSAEDLLLRATVALRKAQADEGSFRVRAFEA